MAPTAGASTAVVAGAVVGVPEAGGLGVASAALPWGAAAGAGTGGCATGGALLLMAGGESSQAQTKEVLIGVVLLVGLRMGLGPFITPDEPFVLMTGMNG